MSWLKRAIRFLLHRLYTKPVHINLPAHFYGRGSILVVGRNHPALGHRRREYMVVRKDFVRVGPTLQSRLCAVPWSGDVHSRRGRRKRNRLLWLAKHDLI